MSESHPQVQLGGHVDTRGIAGPKLEALILQNFAIPFDHRAHPLQRLAPPPPPLPPISSATGRAFSPAPTLKIVTTVIPSTSIAPTLAAVSHRQERGGGVEEGRGRGVVVEAAIEDVETCRENAMQRCMDIEAYSSRMRRVVALHHASAAAALPGTLRVLQFVAVCCSVLQCVECVAVCCSVLQCVAVCCSVLQCVACVCCGCSAWYASSVAACCNVLQCVAVCCSVLQCVAVCCMRHVAYVCSV